MRDLTLTGETAAYFLVCQPQGKRCPPVAQSDLQPAEVKAMISAFEIVLFVVVSLAVAACFTPLFSIRRAMASLGRQGGLWFEHREDRTAEELPDDDAIDAGLPRRPLRARH